MATRTENPANPEKPKIRDTIYAAVHNSNGRYSTDPTAYYFQHIASVLGHTAGPRVVYGPPTMHPLFYDPTVVRHDIPTHVAGLTSMIATSHLFAPAVRVALLTDMVDDVSQSLGDQLTSFMDPQERRPRFIATRVARGIVRREVADAVEREEPHGPTEQYQDLVQVRRRLQNEWGNGNQLAQAGVVASVGLIIARRKLGR